MQKRVIGPVGAHEGKAERDHEVASMDLNRNVSAVHVVWQATLYAAWRLGIVLKGFCPFDNSAPDNSEVSCR